MSGRVRVLIADDSPTVCNALQAVLSEDPLIEVVGCAYDGVQALAKAKKLRPDVITMDVRMPELDGLEATAAIMAVAPARILVVCSVNEKEQQDLSFRAMAAGAIEVIAKPAGGVGGSLRDWGPRLAETVRLMAVIPVVTRRRVPLSRARPLSHGRVDAFGIVASTGGPPALATVLGALPPTLPIPILIAQHMALGFASGLVRWLDSVVAFEVQVAEHGEMPKAGHAYLPKDGHDLMVDTEGLLAVTPSPGGHSPSGDRLLSSLARSYRSRAGGVVLTGMGDDGVLGLSEIRRGGGAAYAQDESTSVVYGMPRQAIESGAAEQALPIESIAGLIRDLCDPRREDRR
jgi:two-component system chemotaxis response regulator CheB